MMIATTSIFLILCVTICSIAAACGKEKLNIGDYKSKWALWDAEGQHLSMDEILAIRKDYGAGIYFFREKRNLDLKKLKESGLMLVMTAHPGNGIFTNEEFLADPQKVRAWAKKAASEPYVDALCLDVESATATTYKYTIQILSEEAHKLGKPFHVAPHFSLDRWNDSKEHVVAEDYNKYADIAWPWLYNRYRQSTYKEGLTKVVEAWKGGGVKIPIYPIFDWGRPYYGGISNAEASDVPAYLRRHGIDSVCLFQPHISYREIQTNPDYRKLWGSLRDNYSSIAP